MYDKGYVCTKYKKQLYVQIQYEQYLQYKQTHIYIEHLFYFVTKKKMQALSTNKNIVHVQITLIIDYFAINAFIKASSYSSTVKQNEK